MFERGESARVFIYEALKCFGSNVVCNENSTRQEHTKRRAISHSSAWCRHRDYKSYVCGCFLEMLIAYNFSLMTYCVLTAYRLSFVDSSVTEFTPPNCNISGAPGPRLNSTNPALGLLAQHSTVIVGFLFKNSSPAGPLRKKLSLCAHVRFIFWAKRFCIIGYKLRGKKDAKKSLCGTFYSDIKFLR